MQSRFCDSFAFKHLEEGCKRRKKMKKKNTSQDTLCWQPITIALSDLNVISLWFIYDCFVQRQQFDLQIYRNGSNSIRCSLLKCLNYRLTIFFRQFSLIKSANFFESKSLRKASKKEFHIQIYSLTSQIDWRIDESREVPDRNHFVNCRSTSTLTRIFSRRRVRVNNRRFIWESRINLHVLRFYVYRDWLRLLHQSPSSRFFHLHK